MTLNPHPARPLASGRCSGWRQGYYGRSATLAVAPHAGLLALPFERIRLIALPGPFRSAGATPTVPARLARLDADKLSGRLHLAAIRARAHQRFAAVPVGVSTAWMGLLPRPTCPTHLAATVAVRRSADRREGLERLGFAAVSAHPHDIQNSIRIAASVSTAAPTRRLSTRPRPGGWAAK